MPDPIVTEIVQNRLTHIAWEGGLALLKTAASPVAAEAKDVGLNIADHLGRTVVYSVWLPMHGTTLGYMLRSCTKRFGQAVFPGDLIMTNDPHSGALHVNDIAIIAPIFHKEELVAWVACATHHSDIGGMAPGWSPQAVDQFQEGLRITPIKIREKGNMREDIIRLFLDNVRMPQVQGLDLRGQIAACNTTITKIEKLTGRYGPDTMKDIYEEIIDFSENKTRDRIASLPEGQYGAVDYIDYDRLYKLVCTLTVKDGSLIFDFTGTDPQAKTFVNSAEACTVANVHNIIMSLLLPGIPGNEGCFRPVQVIVPPGSLLNCAPPAPCSSSSIIAAWKVQNLVIKVLSEAILRSKDWTRGNACWGVGRAAYQLSGVGKNGKWFTLNMAEGRMQGGGARATKDGYDVSNNAGATVTSLPNVESIEQRYPILYLNRGMLRDSGGPGRYRGGLAGEFTIKAHGVDRLEALVFYVGQQVPAEGLQGGGPGSTSLLSMKRGTDVNVALRKAVPSFEDLCGELIVFKENEGVVEITDSDVLYGRCQGGGGFGSPFHRPAELVADDVKKGLISIHHAKEVYGVMVDSQLLKVDAEATKKLRQKRVDLKPKGG